MTFFSILAKKLRNKNSGKRDASRELNLEPHYKILKLIKYIFACLLGLSTIDIHSLVAGEVTGGSHITLYSCHRQGGWEGAGAGGLVFVLMHITDIFRIIRAARGERG